MFYLLRWKPEHGTRTTFGNRKSTDPRNRKKHTMAEYRHEDICAHISKLPSTIYVNRRYITVFPIARQLDSILSHMNSVYTHICLCIPVGVLFSFFLNKILNTFLICPMCITTHLIPFASL
jgi:hypothetical protein